jgi:hypothetical protein
MSACTKIKNNREMLWSHMATRIDTMEQLQPEPLVDMMSDELDKLCKELRYYADQLDISFVQHGQIPVCSSSEWLS